MKTKQMKIGQKIILACGALIFLVLLVQGVVSQMLVRNELKSVAVGRLDAEAKNKTQLLNDLVKQTQQDLSAVIAHKAFEDYFTSVVLEDDDGMLNSEFELESFFIRINRAKPQYTGIELTTATGDPILRIEGENRVQRFSKHDYFSAFRYVRGLFSVTPKIDSSSIYVIHHFFRDEMDGWVLLSTSALVFGEGIEGLVGVYQPVEAYIIQAFSDLLTSGIYYVISDEDGFVIEKTQNMKDEIFSGLLSENLPDWLIASEEVPELGLRVRLGIKKSKAFEVINDLLWVGIGVLVLAALFSMLILGVISRSISKPIKNLVAWAGRISEGDLTLDLDNVKVTNDEIGELHAGYRQVVNSFQKIASVCEDISNGNFSRSLEVKSDKDTLGESVNKMIYTLREMTAENKKENWLKTGQAELSRRISGGQNVLDLSQNIISFFATYLNAQLGAVYVKEDDHLKLMGSYAYTKREGISYEYALGEGLVGQAALEKQDILLADVPEDYFKVQSGLGEAYPRNVVVMPVLYEGMVKGVIELASFNEITDLQLVFLRQATESIAVSLVSAQSRVQMEKLFEESVRQTKELEIRQEELAQKNEELESQTRAFKESEARLENQQEELQQINEELEEQTEALAKQKKDAEEKNLDLEKAQSLIEEKAKALALSNKYKSQFLANMSHELRTPLNSLLLLSKLLSENKENNLTDKQIESLNIIHGAGSELLSLINDVLDLSKIEAGKMDINVDPVVISDLLLSIERNFTHLAEEKGISLTVGKHNGIPGSIRTDRQRVEQILNNLISNAFKFTTQGDIAVNVHRPAESAELSRNGLEASKAIAISVSDTGIGIPEEKQKLIFEAFQQADGKTSRNYGGTGLGLSICRELVRLLGGEIQVQSVERKGSTFTLYLPESLDVDKSSAVTFPVLPPTSDVETLQSDGRAEESEAFKALFLDKPFELEDIRDDRRNITAGDKTILIIEDDPKFAKILYDLTLDKGFKGLIAGDGEAGLYLADHFRPSAIILDVALPRMDGWTVMKRLKDNSKTRHIPVHFISALDKSHKAMQMGAIGYLTKPVNVEKLHEAFSKIDRMISKTMKSLLVVEDNERERKIILELMGGGDIMTTAVGTGQEAYEQLKSNTFDCMVLDLGLPDMTGFELLEKIRSDSAIPHLPIVINTARDLSKDEMAKLRKYSKNIIIKGERSPERLLDETILFLHRVEESLPEEKKKVLKEVRNRETILEGKQILVVDDDMRNIYALSRILEEKGIEVLVSKNGREALKTLDKAPDDIHLILMDIMMPEMDGYETIREIRKQKRFKKLPIIALTAKAMRGDRKKCVEAGASDYMAKPVDVDKLFSLLRVWLYS